MKVVVTGASGFAGTAIVRRLQSHGHDVCPVSRNNAAGLTQVDDYQETPGGDYLIHLAEVSDRQKVNELGEPYLQKTIAVTTAFAKRFHGNVIYASSSTVYGDKHQTPCSEDTEVRKTDLYSEVKLTNEQIVLEHGGTVARIANLFGTGMATSNVLSDIISQLPKQGPLKIRDGYPVRDFLLVDEIAGALSSLLKAPDGIFNVGSGHGMSVKQLSQKVLQFAGQAAREIVSQQTTPHYSRLVLNTQKIKQTTGWEMSQDIDSQLKQFICQEQST